MPAVLKLFIGFLVVDYCYDPPGTDDYHTYYSKHIRQMTESPQSSKPIKITTE